MNILQNKCYFNLKKHLKTTLTIGLSILISWSCFTQTCINTRYVDSLFATEVLYNIDYQSARPYGSLINIPYQLDIYRPLSDTLISRPLMLFQFGGGYLIGDKLNPPAPDFCTYWAERGYVCASINYRLGFNTLVTESAERAVYRAIQDLQAALRFLVDEHHTYGIDTSHIIVSGNSAGAISSMHNAFMDTDQIPASAAGFGFGLDANDLGGPYTSGNTNYGNNEVLAHGYLACWGGMLDTNFVGDRGDDFVPIILFHGVEDDAVSYYSDHPFSFPAFPLLHGSNPLKIRMDNMGMTTSLIPFEGAGHEPELLNPAYLDTILLESMPFIYNEVLRPKLTSVNGNTAPFLNSAATYTVITDDSLSGLCVSLTNGTILNQTTNSVTIEWTTPGHDTVVITGFNHILAFDTIQLPLEVNSISAVNDVFAPQKFRIYPNPSMGNIYIENKDESLLYIDIITVEGKLLTSISTCNQLISIDLKEFSSSLIIVHCRNKVHNSSQLIRFGF